MVAQSMPGVDTIDIDETPKLLLHCIKVYKAMEQQSEPHPEYNDGLVWTGFLTKLVDELGFGIPRYSRIVGMLSEMGCIEQIKRGGGPSPSEWLIHLEPTLDRYEWAKEKDKKDDDGPTPIEQRISDLQDELIAQRNRVDYLEQLLDVVVDRMDLEIEDAQD